MADSNQEKKYFENMSEAFARKAAKVATVMHWDINNPPAWGIWMRIEFEVLKRTGLVEQVSFFEPYTTCRAKSLRSLLLMRRTSETRRLNGLLTLFSIPHRGSFMGGMWMLLDNLKKGRMMMLVP